MELSQGSGGVETDVAAAERSTTLTVRTVVSGSPADRRVRDIAPGPAEHDQAAVNELIRRVQEHDDRRALEAVMAQFDWVAVSCARRMHRRGESMDDLEQIAREALLGAVLRFDLERGVPFRTFAWTTALGMLRHHYRTRWQVRVPRGLQELHLATMRAIQELSTRDGRAPTVDELAEHLRADREDVILAIDVGHAYRADSLDEPLSERGTRNVRHERALAELDDAIEGTVDRTRVRELLASLPVRHRTILMMRFFEDRTQSEIGESLGVSQVHVSRLMRAALCSLRERAGAA